MLGFDKSPEVLEIDGHDIPGEFLSEEADSLLAACIRCDCLVVVTDVRKLLAVLAGMATV